MIARKIENHQVEIGDHKSREAMKDEMDGIRRQRSGKNVKDGEVPL
jgi:hypothetical protein